MFNFFILFFLCIVSVDFIEVVMIVLSVSSCMGVSVFSRKIILETVVSVGFMFISVLNVCVGKWVRVIIFSE